MTTAHTSRIYIVDDSPAIRTRLAEMLGRMPDVRIVGEAGAVSQATVDILALRPESVLLDLNLNGTSGIQLLNTIRPQVPEVVFVVLTNHSEPQYRRACQRAGAAYFLDKSTEFDRVPGVIAEIASTRH